MNSRGIRLLLACFLTALGILAEAANAALPAPVDANAAARLRQHFDGLHSAFAASPFKRPLLIESQQSYNEIRGDIYAHIKHPFPALRSVLGNPANWCDILILHLNTKFCQLQPPLAGSIAGPSSANLILNIGKKYGQPLADSYRLDFLWRAVTDTPDVLQVVMSADSGPLGTHNYRIKIEAIPINATSTFLHLSYDYEFGFASRLLMNAYLNTVGRHKIGFTVTGHQTDGQPIYVDGMLGVVERNTMRYQLAVEAYLDALASPPSAQFERRIAGWFIATERYPLQLHEMPQSDYLVMKRVEYQRQQKRE